MKSQLILLLIMLLIVKTTTQAQQGMWKPFKLVIIQPDTAIIDKSYYSASDSLVIKQQKQYYLLVKNLEDQVNCTGCPDSAAIEASKKDLQLLRSYESEIQRFKYYHVLSNYSIAVYKFYFNEYEPKSTFVELPNQKTDSVSLKMLADTSKADYIVFYSNIHSGGKPGMPVLKLTTCLYSTKDNKVILKKETEGGPTSNGDMWTCSGELECLFINGVRSSTDLVTGILTKRQRRQK
ncbi:hypothetical protein A3860_07870 [Niastella vici]|uniref:Uncharacterized protein n=1 Tax=Niastella vici TaxID=1703345 RepID=A0A1V9FIN9_9BACT|nr:hypothetical protein [Niastella vici]OQP58233.1 hypothetical protein A3860_07870 [Niastella vici]